MAKSPDPLNPTAKEIAAASAWFDTLHWPDLRQAPYVELAFATSSGSKDAENRKMRAFLLGEDDQTITIFCDGTSVLGGDRTDPESLFPCTIQHLSKIPQEYGENLQLPYREIDLQAAVDELLDRRRHPSSKARQPYLQAQRTRMDRTAVFVLARCCAKKGQADLAKRLEHELLKPADTDPAASGQPDANGFLGVVEDTIAMNSYRQVIGDCSDLSVSRPQLLSAFEWIAHAFPNSKTHTWAADIAAKLTPMVAEDEAHAQAANHPASMTQDEKIAESIFRLRDQNGVQTIQPGWCDIFATQTEDSPAEELQKLGLAAVPALIGALEDQRLSRSVGNNPGYSITTGPIWPVGDCAVEILNRIAGRDFWMASSEGIDTNNADDLSEDEARKAYAQKRTAALYRIIKAWWQDVQSRGQTAVLLDGVRLGRRDSVNQAEILVLLDPAAALSAIDDGIQAASTDDDSTDMPDWTRTRLLEIMDKIKTGDVAATLQRQMREGSALHVRLAAAQALFGRGDKKESVAAMVDAWQHWQSLPRKSIFDDKNNPEPLIVFLGTCGDLDAMRALADRFGSLPADYKFKVLEAVTDSWQAMPHARDDDTPLPPEVAAFGEQTAVAALSDRTVRYGMSGTMGNNIPYNNPRVCDMAAHYLAEKWPERYAFEWLPTRVERERFIVQNLNAWRSAHGQAPLPAPERPVQPGTSQQPNLITICEWKGDDALTDPPVGPGKVLTVHGLDSLFMRLHRELPEGCVGFGVTIERPGDRRGVDVQIEWLRGSRPKPVKGWSFGMSIMQGAESLYGGGGGEDCPLPDANPSSRQSVLAYAEGGSGAADGGRRAALIKALDSDPGQSIAIYYSCKLDGD